MNSETNQFYKRIISPLLDKRDSETWHVRAREALHVAESNPLTLSLLRLLNAKHSRFKDERLAVFLGGNEVQLENPVMVGAGWDKLGASVAALYQLGFSGVEVGSVLQYSQPGNDKPRQFIIGPGVSLNRLGFNSPGMEVVARNLEQYRGSGIPTGISLGKNKEVPVEQAPEAHAVVADKLYDDAAYFVINVSSPNTPGLRELQDRKPLTDIVQAVNEAMDRRGSRKPLYIKIAPELTTTAVDDVIDVVLQEGATGIIATNTTTNSDIKGKYGARWANEMGGLSGDDADYRRMATNLIAHIYRETQGRMEIIGVGGVKDAVTAWEKLAAGARAVQVVTAIRGEGPAVAGNVNRGLVKMMDQEGLQNISQVTGIGV